MPIKALMDASRRKCPMVSSTNTSTPKRSKRLNPSISSELFVQHYADIRILRQSLPQPKCPCQAFHTSDYQSYGCKHCRVRKPTPDCKRAPVFGKPTRPMFIPKGPGIVGLLQIFMRTRHDQGLYYPSLVPPPSPPTPNQRKWNSTHIPPLLPLW